MSRLLQFGIFTAGLLAASSALAVPTAPLSSSDSKSTVEVRYHGGYCPPGSKLTSKGGCKVTDWTRHHPAQNPNRYYNGGYYDDYNYNYNRPPPYGYRSPPPSYDDGY
ncbi:hypothetical protein GCM10007874_14780 [Labrys miyagiensis]|uniref:Uncharacterized protein n=1 Tax=Labrys miyagiensis TaxID=346912 RepID=A0ABQ6CDM5_9HYPH|nr:hypothetical protein [Labrys miyagiensis]GLS18461.1 hypothetical protein GCM10007874_14780 [Labrys miyagiensis]